MNIENITVDEAQVFSNRPTFEEIGEKNGLTVQVVDRGEHSKFAMFDRFRASVKGDTVNGGVGSTQEIALRNLATNTIGKSVSVNNGTIDELKTIKF